MFFIIILLTFPVIYFHQFFPLPQTKIEEIINTKPSYWFLLHRKSNKEFLYLGNPGNPIKSHLVKVFRIKTGIPGIRPTPLPKLLGRKYWLITDVSPYFLKLDIPTSDTEPFGPTPYPECNGQCNWTTPGSFGLHGVNGDLSLLSEENEGSSGCIRHHDEDIAFLYNLINPHQNETRYYIVDL